MPTIIGGSGTADPLVDVWFADVGGTWRSNGRGPRLQVGLRNIGGVDWTSRSVLGIPVTELFAAIGASSDITEVLITLTVRGTHVCISIGGDPHLYARRSTDTAPNENATNDECAISGTQTPPSTTTTNQVSWNAVVSANDTVQLDVAALAQDLYDADPNADYLWVVLVSQNESLTGQRVAFDSMDGTDPWTVSMTYTTNPAPDAPSISLTPASGSIVTAPGTRTFTGDFTHSVGARECASVHMIVATDPTVDGDGKLTTGIVHDSDATPTDYNTTTKRWTATRTFTENRGTTYYFQSAVTDDDPTSPKTSGWSNVKYYDVNELPTVSLWAP